MSNTPRKENPVVALLRRARRRIDAGWMRGWFQRKTLCGSRYKCDYCIMGAIGDAVRSKDAGSQRDAINLVAKTIQARGYNPDVVVFNDKYAKGKEDVLSVFDDAIKSARRLGPTDHVAAPSY